MIWMSFLSHMCDSRFIPASDNFTVTAISSGSAAVCSPRSGDPTYPGHPSLALLLAPMLPSSVPFLLVPCPVCALSPGMPLCLLLILLPKKSSDSITFWPRKSLFLSFRSFPNLSGSVLMFSNSDYLHSSRVPCLQDSWATQLSSESFCKPEDHDSVQNTLFCRSACM